MIQHPSLLIQIRDRLHVVLTKEANNRNQCAGLEWIENERAVMLAETNKERYALRRPPISMEDIMRVETMASGHFDYGTKFALYCAELVVYGAQMDWERVAP